MSVGELIRDKRNIEGLTLNDMSDLTGYSIGYLSRIETGKRSAKEETIYEIADLLGISKEEIAKKREVQDMEDNEIDRLLKSIKSKANKNDLINLLEAIDNTIAS